jgi:hypothetical protein
MKKKLIIIITSLVCYTAASSQSSHELAFYGGTGLSALSYTTAVGKTSADFGGQFGVNYNWYFSGNLGIGTGLGLSFYNAQASFARLASKYDTQDMDNVNFEFRSELSGYQEKQNATFLEIPVLLRYRTKGERQFCAAAGAKIGIPLSFGYKTEGAQLAATGFYAYDNVEFGLPEHGDKFNHVGFGSTPPLTTAVMNESIDANIAFILSAEVGINWVYSKTFSLYTGVYLDYGLNDIVSPDKVDALVAYNATNPQNHATNSMLTSRYTTQSGQVKTLVDKVSTLAIGIKLSFVFDVGKKAAQ